jgi:hypothetical protein
MMDYTIVIGRGQDECRSNVKNYIQRGWEPIGGISIAYPTQNFGDGMRETYAQAMIKHPTVKHPKWWQKEFWKKR